MCGNRVEELEEQVQELQATVDGLTDELVECKVRIRELENAVDDDTGFALDEEEVEDAETDTETEPEAADKPNPEAAEEPDEETESESDIIVA